MNRNFSLLLAVLFLFGCATARPSPITKVQEPVKEEKREIKKKELILPEPALPEEKKTPEKTQTLKQPPVIIEDRDKDRYVVINYEDADIKTVITNMAELLGINYILPPRIAGKVTIQTYRKFPYRDLFDVFQSILEMNGLTAVKEGQFYRIVPLQKGKGLTTQVEKGREIIVNPDGSLMTQIIPIQFVKARDAADIIKRLMPEGTDIIVYEPANLLIVTARPRAILKLMKILEAVDLPPAETENIKTFVYYVENGEAKNLASVLKEIYGKDKKSKVKKTTKVATIRKQTPRTPQTTIIGGIEGQIEGEITITPYEDINALIIKASPSDYLTILQTLKKLDIPSKQVLIEVLIGEVTLTDEIQYGLEWVLQRQGELSYTIQNINLGEVGLFGTSETGPLPRQVSGLSAILSGSRGATNINAILNFLASKGALNVLASPHILALDNQEATIEIGDEIPIATGLIQQPATTGATTLVSSGQIQYRTAGIILKVKPHITEKGKVKLKITQEFSSPGQSYKVAGQDFQGFITRRAETTGIVEDGHSLLIGGLISTRNTMSRSGIPLLSDIPLLGVLFGTTNEENVKTELIVIVTPHVISNQQQMDSVLSQFQDRVRTIKKSLREFQGEKDEGEPSTEQ